MTNTNTNTIQNQAAPISLLDRCFKPTFSAQFVADFERESLKEFNVARRTMLRVFEQSIADLTKRCANPKTSKEFYKILNETKRFLLRLASYQHAAMVAIEHLELAKGSADLYHSDRGSEEPLPVAEFLPGYAEKEAGRNLIEQLQHGDFRFAGVYEDYQSSETETYLALVRKADGLTLHIQVTSAIVRLLNNSALGGDNE